MPIVNSGLDNIAQTNSFSATNSTFFCLPIVYAYVSTNTATVNLTDTSLGAGTTIYSLDNGSIAATTLYEADAGANVLRATITQYRVFNFTASYNLTKYGLGKDISGALLTFISLFHVDPNDELSATRVISVDDGDQLQIITTFVIEVPWLTTSKNFTITNVGVVTGNATFYAVTTTNNNIRNAILSAFWPGGNGISGVGTQLRTTITAGLSSARDTTFANAIGPTSRVNPDPYPYSTGTFTKVNQYRMDVGSGNGNQLGWAIGYNVAGGTAPLDYGYKFVLTSPASMTKTTDNTLTMDYTITWNEAA